MENIKQSEFKIETTNSVNSPKFQMNMHLSSKIHIDEIRKQYVPSPNEEITKQYELSDPISDEINSPLKGLVHRYSNRALLKLTNQCEAYCRFCFRREFVGTKVQAFINNDEFDKICDYITTNKQINEIIFSGGDPLILSPRRIEEFCRRLEAIENIKTLRFHTRLPIQAPHKITNQLINTLKSIKKPINIVLHINHISEIDENVKKAISELKNVGNLFSQTVLLKGINDNAHILAETFNCLFGLSIKPYYLHHTDLARGTSHFAVPLAHGMEIYEEISKTLSGLALPNYVLDMPDGSGKIRLCRPKIRNRDDGNFEIFDNRNEWKFYPNIELGV